MCSGNSKGVVMSEYEINAIMKKLGTVEEKLSSITTQLSTLAVTVTALAEESIRKEAKSLECQDTFDERYLKIVDAEKDFVNKHELHSKLNEHQNMGRTTEDRYWRKFKDWIWLFSVATTVIFGTLSAYLLLAR